MDLIESVIKKIKNGKNKSITPVAAGIFTIIASIILAMGWSIKQEFVISPFSTGVTRFNSSLMFFLLGLALVFYNNKNILYRNIAQLVALLFLVIIALATLLQYLINQPLGIDEAIIQDWMPAEQGLYPGRPSPATSVCFLAMGVALLLRLAASLIVKEPIDHWLNTHTKSALPRPLRYALVVYAACILATITTVSLAIIVWITGSADSIFGSLSSGQSLLTSVLFLIICASLMTRLLALKSFEIRFYWLPQSTFVAFLVLGLVIAHNTHDNKAKDYNREISNHSQLIKQMIDLKLDTVIQRVSTLSLESGRALSRDNYDDHDINYNNLIGLVFNYKSGGQQHYGVDISESLPSCTNAPYILSWVSNHLLITAPALYKETSDIQCIHALYHHDAFLKKPWQGLNLKFNTIALGLSYSDKDNTPHGSLINLAGRQINLRFIPTQSTKKSFGQDSRGFFVTLSILFGLVVSIAINMSLKSRRHYEEIAKANIRLSELEARNRKVLEMAPEAVILVDNSGKIIYSNRRSFEILGYKPEALNGQPLEILLPEALRKLHVSHRNRYMYSPTSREMGQNLTLEALHANGKTFPVDIVLSPIEFGDERVVMAIIRDISDKIADQERIERDLQEKVVLLKEVYHRVKNNMQVIASLLRMQSRTADDDKTKNSLNEAALRISALALVHEKLYKSSDLSHVDIKSYIESLVESLRQTYLAKNPLSITIKANDEAFEPEVIIPIGLILNELISNAMKHAFTMLNEDTESAKSAEIDVVFALSENSGYLLSVQDNGRGLPENFDIAKSKSLGLKLIKSLSAQLKGEITIESSTKGTLFRISIPLKALQPAASPLVASGLNVLNKNLAP